MQCRRGGNWRSLFARGKAVTEDGRRPPLVTADAVRYVYEGGPRVTQAPLTAAEIANGQGECNCARSIFPIPERPGISVFYKDPAGQVFHAYSTYARGLDMLNVGYHYLDIVPKGRNEERKRGGRWIRRRDEYADAKATSRHGE